MTRKLIVTVCLILTASRGIAADPATVKIMTQNMDAGTDLNFAIAGFLGFFGPPPGGLSLGVELTYQEILASSLPARTALVAGRIAGQRPDILALQEVALWRTGESLENATTVLYDQLELLLADLTAKGAPYNVIAVNTLGDAALPKTSGGAFRYTDRNALLVRADLRPPFLHISDVHANTYNAAYSIGGLQVPAGWISAMIHTGNRQLWLVNTHLQSAIPIDPRAAAVQEKQATQLLHELRNSTLPVVIAGDFNSDAIQGAGGLGPDNTTTVAIIQAAGFVDTWPIAGTGPGPTWPLYFEDRYPSFFTPAFPFERIDLIFSRGLSVLNVEHIFAPGPTVNTWPFYGSDHAAVVAVFQF